MPVYKDKSKTKDGRQYYFAANYVDLHGDYKKHKSKKFKTKKEARQGVSFKYELGSNFIKTY